MAGPLRKKLWGPLKHLHYNLGPRSATRLLYVLLGAEASLVLGDYLFHCREWIPIVLVQDLFNLTLEQNFGTLFSCSLSFLASLVLYLIFVSVPPNPNWKKCGWGLLSLFFLYLSIDDLLGIHETMGTNLQEQVDLKNAPMIASWAMAQFQSYPWQLVLGPFLGVMAIVIAIMLWTAIRSPRLRLLGGLALACYVMAVGMDYTEGTDLQTRLATHLSLDIEGFLHFCKVAEEWLEMVGTTLFLGTFLYHLHELTDYISVSLKDNKK